MCHLTPPFPKGSEEGHGFVATTVATYIEVKPTLLKENSLAFELNVWANQ